MNRAFRLRGPNLGMAVAVGVDSTSVKVGESGLIVGVVDVVRLMGESGEVPGVIAVVHVPVVVHPARNTKMTPQPAIDLWSP